MSEGMRSQGKDLVSIVVPVYNAERFLEETIGHVQAQTFQEWELLLVDDCSTDAGRECIARMSRADSRIRLIVQGVNGGAARARNRGISEARGRYLCFLDADDIWLPDKLATELAAVSRIQASDPGAGFFFMGYEFADEDGAGLGRVVHVPERITYEEALKNTTIFTSTVMIDRSRIPDEDIIMPCVPSEDTATWWQILKRHGTGYGIDRVLVRYRRSAHTLSSNKMTAIRRIWQLYRRQEGFGVARSAYCLSFWAWRAVRRRVG